jgi:hypothetical protein
LLGLEKVIEMITDNARKNSILVKNDKYQIYAAEPTITNEPKQGKGGKVKKGGRGKNNFVLDCNKNLNL